MENLSKINNLRSLSLAQIVLFASNILSFIVFIVCVVLLGASLSNLNSPIEAKSIQVSSLGIFSLFVLVIFVMISIATFVINILLIITINDIKNVKNEYKTSFILLVIGFVIPICSFIAAIIIFSWAKKNIKEKNLTQNIENN